MKTRFFILVFLLAVVGGLTVWRVNHPRTKTKVSLDSLDQRPAPEFQLLDQNSRPIQLKGYVGRYRVLVYFFASGQTLDADPVLLRLREVYPALKRSGVMAFAISSPLGPVEKPKAVSFPFPILRDTVAGQPASCSTRWGRTQGTQASAAGAKIQPAAFLVEATGMVDWEGDFPKPADDAIDLINDLVAGRR
jgi:peroxiredoxin